MNSAHNMLRDQAASARHISSRQVGGERTYTLIRTCVGYLTPAASAILSSKDIECVESLRMLTQTGSEMIAAIDVCETQEEIWSLSDLLTAELIYGRNERAADQAGQQDVD